MLQEELPNKICISGDSLPIRLDRAIASNFTAYSRATIQNLIQNGNVRVSGKIVTDCSYQVKHPALVEFTKIQDQKKKQLPSSHTPLLVAFEDDDIIILDKPHGIAVHPTSNNSNKVTLVDLLKLHCGKDLSDISGPLRPGIVHRLDANTSGLMVVAKNNAAHKILSDAFASKQVERLYIALVFGVPSLQSGIISANIKRSTRDRTKMTITNSGGRRAVTHYTVMETFRDKVSMLECRLDTGRTHQIRIHMSFKNHPIIGDKIYISSKNFNLSTLSKETTEAINSMSRQALHSYKISLQHPITNTDLMFESALPQDIQHILDLLRLDITS